MCCLNLLHRPHRLIVPCSLATLGSVCLSCGYPFRAVIPKGSRAIFKGPVQPEEDTHPRNRKTARRPRAPGRLSPKPRRSVEEPSSSSGRKAPLQLGSQRPRSREATATGKFFGMPKGRSSKAGWVFFPPQLVVSVLKLIDFLGSVFKWGVRALYLVF